MGPARIESVVPDHASQSSQGTIDVDKILQDLRRVSSAARAAIDYFRMVENEVRRERYDLASYPELAISQVYRMRAMISAGAEEARQDLELRRIYLAGELRDPTLESVFGSDIAGGLELGARRLNANEGAGAPADIVDSGLAQFLGRRLQEDQRNSRLPSLH